MKDSSADQPEPIGSTRRTMLKGALGLGVSLTFAPALTLAQGDAASVRPREGDHLIKIGDPALTPLTADDVPLSQAPTMAWALDPSDKTVRSGSRLNRVLLVRLEPESLSARTRALAAGGVVAYTAICTHSGCDVSDWLADEQVLYCSCHQTKFDPRDGARVVEGPASRSLPALPLKVVDGALVVAGGFTARVGFDEV